MTIREIRAELTKSGKKISQAKFLMALDELKLSGKASFTEDERRMILKHFGVSFPTGVPQEAQQVPQQTIEDTEVSALTVVGQSVAGLAQVHNLLDVLAHQHSQQLSQRIRGFQAEVLVRTCLDLQQDQTQPVDVIGTLYAALAPGKPTYALKPADPKLFLECM